MSWRTGASRRRIARHGELTGTLMTYFFVAQASALGLQRARGPPKESTGSRRFPRRPAPSFGVQNCGDREGELSELPLGFNHEALLRPIEVAIAAPDALPGSIVEVVEQLSSATVPAPRTLRS